MYTNGYSYIYSYHVLINIFTQTVGRLCQLLETPASQNTRESCSDLQTYIDTLETPASCNSGEPGKLVWTPDENTPDLVYYQVYIY